MVKKKVKVSPKKKGQSYTAEERLILGNQIEEMRVKENMTFEQTAKQLKMAEKTAIDIYKKYMKNKIKQFEDKDFIQQEILETLQRQKDIIARAKQKGIIKTEEIANRNYLSMLQDLGYADKAAEKHKIEAKFSVGSLRKYLEGDDDGT